MLGNNKTNRPATALLVILTAAPALAYLPANWSNKHANGDFQKAALVLVGRVIAINRAEDFVPKGTNTTVAFHYIAKVIVAKVFRGDIQTNQVLHVPIGGYWQKKLDEGEPEWVRQCNTQRGFDLKINGVYLMALDMTADSSGHNEWVPRSGHRSLYEIRRFGDRLLIRTPKAWDADVARETFDHLQFATNSIPLHDFVSRFVAATNDPYTEPDFWERRITNQQNDVLGIDSIQKRSEQ